MAKAAGIVMTNCRILEEGGRAHFLTKRFDLTYSHNPAGLWTNQHQLSIAGKRDGFTRDDLIGVGKSISLKSAAKIVDEVVDAVSRWPEFAEEADIPLKIVREIAENHRLSL